MAFFTPGVIAAGIGAAGAIGGGLLGMGATANTDNSAAIQANQIAQNEQQLTRSNIQYQQALATLMAQRGIAGTSDSFGSTLRYDPATNTWVSQLGALPQAAQTSAEQAGIRRNTTEQRLAEFANEQAALRAAQAGPNADAARRQLGNFRDMPAEQLIGLLQNRATTANNEVFRPLVADTLRSFARTGTAAGPVLAQIGRQSSDELRKSLIDSQIAGMTNVDQINQQRRSGLEQSAAGTATLASPQFQSTGITPDASSSTMASLLADRAKSATTAGATGGFNVNQSVGLDQGASRNVQNTIPDPNFNNVKMAQIGNQLSALSNPDNALAKSIAKMFGPSTNAADNIDSGAWS